MPASTRRRRMKSADEKKKEAKPQQTLIPPKADPPPAQSPPSAQQQPDVQRFASIIERRDEINVRQKYDDLMRQLGPRVPIDDPRVIDEELNGAAMNAYDAFVLAEIAKAEREVAADEYRRAQGRARKAHADGGVKGVCSESWMEAWVLDAEPHVLQRLRKMESARAELKFMAERFCERERDLRALSTSLSMREGPERRAAQAAYKEGAKED